jgi:hypothetical protein
MVWSGSALNPNSGVNAGPMVGSGQKIVNSLIGHCVR